MVKKVKKQTIELELNELMAEALIQCLRHPGPDALSALKENIPGIDGDVFYEVTSKLENEICDQISWGMFR